MVSENFYCSIVCLICY